mmetsp:Transcript_103413/g.269984  ORF Transcript_103413/g.269984 Transcript_103413/m.269984 type:complete len:91 (-) Transcript_103413:91-363(-)
MSTVFKKMAVGGRISVFKAAQIYRPGSIAAPSITKVPLSEALATAKTKVTFLEVDTLKGLPVNPSVSIKTIDPYLASYVSDMHAAFFGAK